MRKTDRIRSRAAKGVCAFGLSAAMALSMTPAMAFAASSSPFSSDDPTAVVTPATNLLKTYGVRAGSAGADYLGISNTNFDFTAGPASSSAQYTAYASASERQLAGLAIWGSGQGSGQLDCVRTYVLPSQAAWGTIKSAVLYYSSAIQGVKWLWVRNHLRFS